MPVEPVTYYEASCDGCERQAEFGDFTAYKHQEHVEGALPEQDWTTDGERWHCDECPALFPPGTQCEECGDALAVRAYGSTAVCADCAREHYEVSAP